MYYVFIYICIFTRSKDYMTLLELIRDQDLMMRKQTDNVEILVLTSTVLQMDCQSMLLSNLCFFYLSTSCFFESKKPGDLLFDYNYNMQKP